MKVVYIPRRIFTSLCFVLCIVLISILYASGGGFQLLNVFLNTQKEIPINSVDTQQKKVALTFDAAYGPEYTEEILGILDKYNIKATFFLVGNWALRYPEKVKEIYSRGHEIGNHSDTHPHFTKLNPKQMRQEIYLSDSKIKSITGKDTELFRPPFGDYNSEVVKKIWETGHYCIQWDVDSLDWTNPGEDKIYKNVMDNVQNGSIILFHNNAEQTPKVLGRIITDLTKKGYSFEKISDLIYKEGYYIDHNGKQRKVRQ